MTSELTGVILAAGKGNRIDPFNAQFPKPLLPIANKPIIAHHIEIFCALEIRQVKIVVGHLADKIITEFGRGQDYGIEIEYVEQTNTLGIAHAVGALSDVVHGDFMLVLGDVYYSPHRLKDMLAQFDSQGGGAVLAVMHEKDVNTLRKNFSVELGENKLVRRVVEKPRLPLNNLKGCGIYLFSEDVFDAIQKTPRTALRDEYEITTTLQILCDDGVPVSVAEVVAWDYNVTFARDLLHANLKYLKENGQIQLIDESAKIHEEARLENVVIGADVLISAPVTIKNAVILPGVAIDHEVSANNVIISKDEWFQC